MEAKLYSLLKKSKYESSKNEIQLVGGCFMAFRRKVFNDVKGFWEFPHMEQMILIFV